MFEQIKLYISNKWEKLYPLLFSSMICLLLYFFKDNEIIDNYGEWYRTTKDPHTVIGQKGPLEYVVLVAD